MDRKEEGIGKRQNLLQRIGSCGGQLFPIWMETAHRTRVQLWLKSTKESKF